MQEVIIEQGNESYWFQTLSTIGNSRSRFNYDRKGPLTTIELIYGAVQKVFPISLRARLLYQSHCPKLAGHQDDRRYTAR